MWCSAALYMTQPSNPPPSLLLRPLLPLLLVTLENVNPTIIPSTTLILPSCLASCAAVAQQIKKCRDVVLLSTSSSNRQFLPLALFLSPAPPSSPGCHTVRSPSHSPPPTFFQPHPRHQGVGQTCHQATLHQPIFSQLHPRHPTLLLKSGATAEDHPDSGAGAARAGSRGP